MSAFCTWTAAASPFLRAALTRVAVKVKPSGRLKISGHEEDNRVYECLAAKANYIVTENSKDFPVPYKYTKITTARALLAELARQSQQI